MLGQQRGVRMAWYLLSNGVFFSTFFILTWSEIATGANSETSREAVFRPYQDKFLGGTPLLVVSVLSAFECAMKCTAVTGCQSYNFAHAQDPKHQCELNGRNKASSPADFMDREGFIYYEILTPEPPPPPEVVCTDGSFSANFTSLGTSGRLGPTSLGNHYQGKAHDGQVTLVSGIQQWTVPLTGKYRIEAVGASGGTDTYANSELYRGRGAQIRGIFDLTKGETIKILVGQAGQTNTASRASGGGGASFVARGNNIPLIVAGGGGGLEALYRRHAPCDASVNTSGNPSFAGQSKVTWPGGADGKGASTADDSYSGGGGGGFLTDGRSSKQFGGAISTGGEGGKAFINGGVGGQAYSNNQAAGGFGGGGGGYGSGGGAGGGGGYSGGASGDNSYDSCGGGGGSYNTGVNPSSECCFNNFGHGYVFIQQVSCT